MPGVADGENRADGRGTGLMTTDESNAGIRAELKDVEAELADLRRTAAEVRRRVGERWDSPADAEETASAIALAEEQETLIAALEARRDQLLRRLGEDS
jgi:F0F1-type ATP synthase membrane subunit b/b'